MSRVHRGRRHPPPCEWNRILFPTCSRRGKHMEDRSLSSNGCLSVSKATLSVKKNMTEDTYTGLEWSGKLFEVHKSWSVCCFYWLLLCLFRCPTVDRGCPHIFDCCVPPFAEIIEHQTVIFLTKHSTTVYKLLSFVFSATSLGFLWNC